MTNFAWVALAFSAFLAGSAHALTKDSPQLEEISGVVQVQGQGAEGWVLVRRAPLALSTGDSLRTGYGAHAVISLAGGARLELGASAQLRLVEAARYRVELSLTQGTLRVLAPADPLRSLEVRTPGAESTLRALQTEAAWEVRLGGRTTVDLRRGLLGVEDSHGAAVLLHPNERLELEAGTMGNPVSQPAAREARRLRFHERMQHELALDLAKDNEQSAAARERKIEEYQQGKVLMDLNGDRVRVESLMLRPAPDEFKLVVLNGRASGLSYFSYQGTFNQSLPRDLSVPFSQLPGRAGAAPDYWLTAFQTVYSNGRDAIVASGQGGHPINVNNDGDPGDAASLGTWLFDPKSNSYVNVAGQDVYRTFFDSYGLSANGVLKYGWAGHNVQNSADQQLALLTNQPVGSTTYPQAAQAHSCLYESYYDGTSLQWDRYGTSFGGQAVQAAAPGSLFSAPGAAGLLDFGFEQRMTASEFGGRSIDLVIAPKALVQTGLLP